MPGSRFREQICEGISGQAKEALQELSQEEVSEDSPYYEIVSKLYNDANYYYQVQDYPRVMNYLEKIILLFPANRMTRDLMVKVTLKLDPAAAEKFLGDHYGQAVKEFHCRTIGCCHEGIQDDRVHPHQLPGSGSYINKILEATRQEAIVTIPLKLSNSIIRTAWFFTLMDVLSRPKRNGKRSWLIIPTIIFTG